MRPMLTLFRREFTAYFLSPIAYVVMAVFLLMTGHLFYLTMKLLTETGPSGTEFPMQTFLGDVRFWLVFLFIPPLLTMRLFAEERGSGTLEMLLTAPLRDWQVVLAKYVACLAFYFTLWLPTLLYLPVLVKFNWTTLHAGIDPRPVWTSYLGLAMAGAMFLAVGLFVSSLVRSQMVAALISLVLSLVFVVEAFWPPPPEWDMDSLAYRLLYFFSVPLHFQRDFTRGLVDSRHLILYASVALFCLFLTVRSVESRRWR
ncbi:MAG TPA: ABC transporter permease [Gemmataceae bacterium]|jgi:ABC-2 type transport system permease protein|nr:ABC transporter permease [Gemmataceae bacterium]